MRKREKRMKQEQFNSIMLLMQGGVYRYDSMKS